MEKDLRLEAYASKTRVKPVKLHEYRLISSNMTDHVKHVIRAACWRVRRSRDCGVFENGRYIYTTEEISTDIPNADFRLEYSGCKELDVQANKNVYEDLIKYHIIKNLVKVKIYEKYNKYSCRSDVTSKFIMTENGFSTIYSDNKEICLERKYNFQIEITEDNYACMYIETTSEFTSNLNIADYIQRGKNIIGMLVKNEWGKNRQVGTVLGMCDHTVIDPLKFAPNLKAYYIDIGQADRVKDIPDDTIPVKVMLNGKSEVTYYPQALKPVLSREVVGVLDSKFSLKVDKYIKRDMSSRIALDRDFIHDIGVISALDNLEFEQSECPVERLGFKKGYVEPEKLICGNNKRINCRDTYQVFNNGFYKKPGKALRIGYVYPKGMETLMKVVANTIYSYAVLGKYHNKDDAYTKTALLDIQTEPMIKAEYTLDDITDYKRSAKIVGEVEGIDIVIAIVPNGSDDDSPYNPFKTIWADANIPSQMISIDTAQLFARDKSNTTKYYLQNIVLGILGKTGGIPWIVENMPGNVDCFVGLDVAMIEAGIHFPACSVLFDKFGRLLGFYKPKQVQKGEKIKQSILQDIFDQVLLTYEATYGNTPKNIVIHRDGFSNEDDSWYEDYFNLKGISYTLVEVRKNIGRKLAILENDEVKNPDMGYCVYKNDIAYLVSTDMSKKKGSPNPILLEKKHGDLPMKDIIKQVLYLSELHVGSTQKMRLPITTGYADKICKNREFVPEGKMQNRLFFL